MPVKMKVQVPVHEPVRALKRMHFINQIVLLDHSDNNMTTEVRA